MVWALDDSFIFCRLELKSLDLERNRAGFKLLPPQGVVEIKGNGSQGKLCGPVMEIRV